MTSIVDGNEAVVKSDGKLIDKKHIEDSIKIGKSVYDIDNIDNQFLPCDIPEINLPYLAEFVKKYPQFIKTEGSF